MYQLLYISSVPPDDGLKVCPKHVEVDWRNKLKINSAASCWFLVTQMYRDAARSTKHKHIFSSQISYMFRPNMGYHQADHEKEKSNIYTVLLRLGSQCLITCKYI